MAWGILTSPAHSVVKHTNDWATEHVTIVNRLSIYLSVGRTHFIAVKITSTFRMTA